MTKEELTQKNGALLDQLASINTRDKELRERFSKILDAPTRRDFSYETPKPTLYSWEEIFFEIGKLMPETDKAHIGRFNATLDILLEKLAHQSRLLNTPGESAIAGHEATLRRIAGGNE